MVAACFSLIYHRPWSMADRPERSPLFNPLLNGPAELFVPAAVPEKPKARLTDGATSSGLDGALMLLDAAAAEARGERSVLTAIATARDSAYN
jgi:hypothetical protein